MSWLKYFREQSAHKATINSLSCSDNSGFTAFTTKRNASSIVVVSGPFPYLPEPLKILPAALIRDEFEEKDGVTVRNKASRHIGKNNAICGLVIQRRFLQGDSAPAARTVSNSCFCDHIITDILLSSLFFPCQCFLPKYNAYVIKFTHKVYTLIFRILLRLCNYLHYLIPKHFYIANPSNSCLHCQSLCLSTSLRPHQRQPCFSTDLPVCIFHINRII